MKRILIIYPHDDTSAFLLESFHYLQEKIKSVTFFEIFPNDNSHEECNVLIAKSEIIIFMGHGSSNKLSGSKNENYSIEYLISVIELSLLNPKKWILFSCNSNDFLKKCSLKIISGIGFGNLPTDFNDIGGIREFDAEAYSNVNEDVIGAFKKSLNWIISESILQFIKYKINLTDLFYLLKILITRKMLDIMTNPKDKNQAELTKLLFDMKRDMVLINENVN